jgi:hypothetical protein
MRAQEHVEELTVAVTGIKAMEGDKFIVTEKQMIPETRCSNRIQEQMLKNVLFSRGGCIEEENTGRYFEFT